MDQNNPISPTNSSQFVPSEVSNLLPAQTTQSLPLEPVSRTEPSVVENHSKKLSFLIVTTIIIVVLALSIVGVIWKINQTKESIRAITEKQIDELVNLDKTYQSIGKLVYGNDSLPGDAQNVDLLNAIKDSVADKNSLNFGGKTASDSATSEESTDNDGQDELDKEMVLGIEDDLGITQNRKLSQRYKDAIVRLDNIGKNAKTIEDSFKSNIFALFVTKPDKDLFKDTKSFVDRSKPLMAYLDSSNTMQINGTLLGYKIGLALQELILRSADDESVQKYEEKLKEIDGLYRQSNGMDISELPEELQIQHKEELDSYSSSVAVFYELLHAAREKDIERFYSAIQSLSLQGASQVGESQIKFTNFWQNNITINATDRLIEKWSEYGKKVGISE
jgi:hypothetical protein